MPAATLDSLLPFAAAAPASAAIGSADSSEPISPRATSPDSPSPEAVATASRLILNAISQSVFAALHPSTTPATADPVAGSLSLPELLAHFLSDDERRILRVLASAPAGAQPSASWVMERVVDDSEGTVSTSAFWEIWRQLRFRGLVVEHGEGKRRKHWYGIGPDWLRLLLA